MPFHFSHPQPPTTYTKISNNGRSWPEDRYDNTGGSFPVRPDRTCIPCTGKKQSDLGRYTENYFRKNLMVNNPVTLCALKNTKQTHEVLSNPPIKFTSPKFIHKSSGRSKSLLRVSRKHQVALCKINENLVKHDEEKDLIGDRQLSHEQRLIKNTLAEEHKSKSKKHLRQQIKGKHPGREESSVTLSFKSKLQSDEMKKKDDLMKRCKEGTLLGYIRERVVEDIRSQACVEQLNRDKQFPSLLKLPYKLGQFPERYSYDPDCAMSMLCKNKHLLARFYESLSDEKMKHRDNVLDEESFTALPRSELHKLEKTPMLFQLLAHGPLRTRKGQPTTEDANDAHSHLGLIDAAKQDALKRFVGEMHKRKLDVTLPAELTEQAKYGPVEGVPIDYPHASSFLNLHLPAGGLETFIEKPTEAEWKRVEVAIKCDDMVKKVRRRQGLVDHSTDQYQHEQEYFTFSKSLIETENKVTRKGYHDLETLDQLLDCDPATMTNDVFIDALQTVLPLPINASKAKLTNEKVIQRKSLERASKTVSEGLSWMELSRPSSSKNLERELQEQEFVDEMRRLTANGDSISFFKGSSSPRIYANEQSIPAVPSISSSMISTSSSRETYGDLHLVDSRLSLPIADIRFSEVRLPKLKERNSSILYKNEFHYDENSSSSDGGYDVYDTGEEADDENVDGSDLEAEDIPLPTENPKIPKLNADKVFVEESFGFDFHKEKEKIFNYSELVVPPNKTLPQIIHFEKKPEEHIPVQIHLRQASMDPTNTNTRHRDLLLMFENKRKKEEDRVRRKMLGVSLYENKIDNNNTGKNNVIQDAKDKGKNITSRKSRHNVIFT